MIRDDDGCVLVSYEEGFACLDTLQRAYDYLAKQFSLAMPREVAQAHFDARALLMNHRWRLLDEMELEYKYGEAEQGTEEK